MPIMPPNANLDPSADNDNDDDDDDDKNETNNLPAKGYEKLIVGDNSYDLRNSDDADKALQDAQNNRQKLRDGQLAEYEGKSTEFGQGGRSRLLYDEVRSQMAVDYHDEKHNLAWDQQHQEAQRIISLRASQYQAQQAK